MIQCNCDNGYDGLSCNVRSKCNKCKLGKCDKNDKCEECLNGWDNIRYFHLNTSSSKMLYNNLRGKCIKNNRNRNSNCSDYYTGENCELNCSTYCNSKLCFYKYVNFLN